MNAAMIRVAWRCAEGFAKKAMTVSVFQLRLVLRLRHVLRLRLMLQLALWLRLVHGDGKFYG